MPRFIFAFLFLCFSSLTIANQKTVCLNMIVKNEQAVISRCLQSVLPIIDTWVIVDTGSNDGTQKIIEDFFAEKNIPGKLYERPWVNFGHNRNEAFSLAKNRADYILFMDADDLLSFAEDFILPDLTEDFYLTTSYDGRLASQLPRIVKTSRDWKWQGVIHEYVAAPDVRGSPLPGVSYIYNHDGARAKDPTSLERDLALLQSDPSPRNLFYTICTYLQMKKPEEALEACKKRILVGDREEETFMAYMIQSDLEHMLGKGWYAVKESLIKAYALRPHRFEPLYVLSTIFWDEKNYELGYELIRLAVLLPQENRDMLCVQTWIHEYGLSLQYALFCAMTHRYEEGLQTIEPLFSKKLTQEHLQKAQECKSHLQQQLRKECMVKIEAS
jgi:glycosyltransferase involved in cell wall biosynthesis